MYFSLSGQGPELERPGLVGKFCSVKYAGKLFSRSAGEAEPLYHGIGDLIEEPDFAQLSRELEN